MNPLTGFLVEDLRFADKAHARETWVLKSAVISAFEKWQVDSGLEDKKGFGISASKIGKQLRDFGGAAGSKRIGTKLPKVWFGVTLGPECENRHESCQGSYVPSEMEHLTQLASKGISIIACSDVPGLDDGSDAHAQKNTRPPPIDTRGSGEIPIGNFPSHAPGNDHTDREHRNISSIPDLDSYPPDF
jgi:hypothetical protein